MLVASSTGRLKFISMMSVGHTTVVIENADEISHREEGDGEISHIIKVEQDYSARTGFT